MRTFLIFFYMTLMMISLAFAALNSKTVVVNLYWQTYDLPLAFIMIVCIGVGLLLGILVLLGRYWHLRCLYSRCKNQVSILEKEIKNLRSIPIQDSH